MARFQNSQTIYHDSICIRRLSREKWTGTVAPIFLWLRRQPLPMLQCKGSGNNRINISSYLSYIVRQIGLASLLDKETALKMSALNKLWKESRGGLQVAYRDNFCHICYYVSLAHGNICSSPVNLVLPWLVPSDRPVSWMLGVCMWEPMQGNIE